MSSSEEQILGRDKELNELRRIWDVATAGNPQWVTLIGETGTGKTRLVQEFFRHLSCNEDEPKYWPNRLVGAGKVLHLNPLPDAFERQGDQHEMDMPWLWWGLRSVECNATAQSAVHAALESFAIHVEPLKKMHERQQARMEAGKEIAKNLGNMLTAGFLEPFLGMVSLVEKGADAVKAGKAVAITPADVADARNQSMNTLVIDSLFRVLELQIPVILVLDDCHWLDAETVSMLETLCHKLANRKLKLMIVATSWKREYQSANSNRLSRLLAREVDGRPLVGSFYGSVHEILLGGLDKDDACSVAIRHLPGLSERDCEHIYDRTRGNLRHIEEICTFLETQPRNFECDDKSGSLSELGRKKVLSKETEMDRLVESRFTDLIPEVQRCLEDGSYQGPQFDLEIVTAISKSVIAEEVSNRSVVERIEEAEDPGSMITSIDATTREFLPGPYWRVTRESLREYREEEVSERYKALLPKILSLPLASLRPTHLAFIAAQAEISNDINIVMQCRIALLRSYCMMQRFEAAYEQLAKLVSNRHGYSGAWSGELAEDVLFLIAHFGLRPPVAMDVEPGACARIFSQTVFEEANNLNLQSADTSELASHVRRIRLNAASRDALGEMLDAAYAHAQLARFISEASSTDQDFDEESIVMMVSSLFIAVERIAPYQSSLKWAPGEIARWLDAARKLCRHPTLSTGGRDLLTSLVSVIELELHAAPADGEPEPRELQSLYAAAANKVGEVLAVKYSSVCDKDSVRMLTNPEADLALAVATSRVIEQALEIQARLATAFLDRVAPMVESIGKDAISGKYLSAPLAASLVDVVLGAAILAKRESGRVVSNDPDNLESKIIEEFRGKFEVFVAEDRVISQAEVSNWAQYALVLATSYFPACMGSIEFLVARARSFVFNLEVRPDARASEGKKYFDLVLDDAIAAEDDKRQAYGEPTQLKEWLQKICEIGLSGSDADVARASIAEFYGT